MGGTGMKDYGQKGLSKMSESTDLSRKFWKDPGTGQELEVSFLQLWLSMATLSAAAEMAVSPAELLL